MTWYDTKDQGGEEDMAGTKNWREKRLRDLDWQSYLRCYRGDSILSSPSSEVEKQSFPRPLSELPIDYLGFGASYGLKFYVEQQMKSISADSRSCTANYLLCCPISSRDLQSVGWRSFRLCDLVGILLKYGGNPNTQAFGSTVWVCS